jgi:hypothetical protein
MGQRRSTNIKRKEKMKRCWERSKTVTRPARNAKNEARAATNISLGLEPTYRYGAEYKDKLGKRRGIRRDTHAWSVARAARKAKRASAREVAERARIRAEADESAIDKALRILAKA